MAIHTIEETEKAHSRMVFEWGIRLSTLENLPEKHQAVVDFQDFTDFFGDLIEKTDEHIKKLKRANSNFNDGLAKYIGLNMIDVETKDQLYAPVRVSLVDMDQNVVYDKIVRPDSSIIDKRDCGLSIEEIEAGTDIQTVHAELNELLEGKIVIGHTLSHFMLAFFKPPHYVDLALYNQLHFLIMAITQVRYNGMMSLREMSQFLLGDAVSNLEMSNSIDCAKTIIQMFYYIVGKFEQDFQRKCFIEENAKRDDPFDVKELAEPREGPRKLVRMTQREYLKKIQLNHPLPENYRVDWET